MKVKISNFPTHYGTEHIAKALLFWLPKEHPLVERLDNWLMGYDPERDYTPEIGSCYDNWEGSWLHRTLNAINVWRDNHRTIKVHIDRWDTVNMNSTLTVIILPMLKQLKATKHGSPFVDDEDVPEHLRSTAAPELSEQEKNWGETDASFHDRWAYVLDEMIFAFELEINDEWDDEYHKSGDYDAMNVVGARQKNGFRLFGKYYQGLWD